MGKRNGRHRLTVTRAGTAYHTLTYDTHEEAKAELDELAKHLGEGRANDAKDFPDQAAADAHYAARWAVHRNWVTERAAERFEGKLTADEKKLMPDLLQKGRGVATTKAGHVDADGGLYVVMGYEDHIPFLARKEADEGQGKNGKWRWFRYISEDDKNCDGLDGVSYFPSHNMFVGVVYDVTEGPRVDEKHNPKYKQQKEFRCKEDAKEYVRKTREEVEKKKEDLCPRELKGYPAGEFGKAEEAERGTIYRVFIATKWVTRVVKTHTTKSGAGWVAHCSHVGQDGTWCTTAASGTLENGFCGRHGGGTRCEVCKDRYGRHNLTVQRAGTTYHTLTYDKLEDAKAEQEELAKHLGEGRSNDAKDFPDQATADAHYAARWAVHRNWVTERAVERFEDKLTAEEKKLMPDLLQKGRGVATTKAGHVDADGGLYVVMGYEDHIPFLARKEADEGQGKNGKWRWFRYISEDDKNCDGLDGVSYFPSHNMFQGVVHDVTEGPRVDEKHNPKYKQQKEFRCKEDAKEYVRKTREEVEKKKEDLCPRELKGYPAGEFGKAGEAERGTIYRVFIDRKWVTRVARTHTAERSGAGWSVHCSHVGQDGAWCTSAQAGNGFCVRHGGGTRCEVCRDRLAHCKIAEGMAIPAYNHCVGLRVCVGCRGTVTGNRKQFARVEHLVLAALQNLLFDDPRVCALFLQNPIVHEVADCPLAGTLYRPDLMTILDGLTLCVEVDENQHVTYCLTSEPKRLNELFIAADREVTELLGPGREQTLCVLRFNPDGYTDADGVEHESCFGQRTVNGEICYEAIPNGEFEARMDALVSSFVDMVEAYAGKPREPVPVVKKLFFCRDGCCDCEHCSRIVARPCLVRREVTSATSADPPP